MKLPLGSRLGVLSQTFPQEVSQGLQAFVTVSNAFGELIIQVGELFLLDRQHVYVEMALLASILRLAVVIGNRQGEVLLLAGGHTL